MDLSTLALIPQASFFPYSVQQKAAEGKVKQEIQYTLEHVVRLLPVIADEHCNLHPSIGASDKRSKILLCEKDLLRLKRDVEGAPVSVIIDETFPCLLNTFQKLVQIQYPSIEVVDLIKLICKILWSSIHMECPKQLLNANVLNEWMSLFLIVLERPIPLEGQPADIELRNSRGWWKVKKWTVKILNHLFIGFAKNTKSYNKAFAKMFEKNYGGKILESCLNLLNAMHVDSGYLPDKVFIHILQYLTNSVLKINMYNLLQPRLRFVLSEIIFPLMCFNDKDQKLWEENPYEYVKNTVHSPRTAGIDFLNVLVRKHEKDTLQKIVNFIIEKFEIYDEDSEKIEEHRQKDGALLAFGALSERIMFVGISRPNLKRYLRSYVFPEFTSPVGHLRAKAVWVAGEFANSIVMKPDLLRVPLRNVIGGMHDSEYPVRVNSVIALRSFVQACDRFYHRHRDIDLDVLSPLLPQLIDDVFRVMNEAVNTDLVYTIETFVEMFEADDIAPHALQLCQNLADAFWKYMNSAYGNEKVDNQAVFAALCCLRAILRTLEASSNHHRIFVDIEPILLPIMSRMLTTEGQEMYEEVLEIVSYMVAFPLLVSMNMWSLWPLIADAPVMWVIEFFTDISFTLQNYISKDTQHFLTCKEPNYQHSLWKMISTIMGDKKLKDIDIEPAPKLIETIFQNCRGQVDHWLEPYIRITVERLQRTEGPSLKCLLMQVIADALYYNASLTLNILQNLGGVASEIFNLWFHMLQETKKSGRRSNFTREQEKKVCCLGLTSLLLLPVDQLPGEETLERVYKANLDLLVAYKDQVEENAKEFEDGDKIDVYESSNANESAKKSRVDDREFDFNDYERVDSRIDEVDPFLLFSDTLKGMEASDPLKLQNLTLTLDSHFRSLADCLAQYTEKRRLYLIRRKQHCSTCTY